MALEQRAQKYEPLERMAEAVGLGTAALVFNLNKLGDEHPNPKGDPLSFLRLRPRRPEPSPEAP